MPFSGTVARVIYSILTAIVAYIILLILAWIANNLGAGDIGSLLTRFAPIIAVLAAIGYFLSGSRSV